MSNFTNARWDLIGVLPKDGNERYKQSFSRVDKEGVGNPRLPNNPPYNKNDHTALTHC